MFLLSRFHRSFVSFLFFILLSVSTVSYALSPVTNELNISGTVTDIDTGQALSGVTLKLYAKKGSVGRGSEGGSFYSITLGPYTVYETDATGEFVFSGLSLDGEYYLQATGKSDYLDAVYGSPAACDGWGCDPFLGEPLLFSTSESLSGINISLQKTGSISGRVTDVETGQPISNVNVTVCDFSGARVNSGLTDVNGDYQVGGLLSGDYFLRFSTNDGPYYLRHLTDRDNYASELLGGEPSPSDSNCVYGESVGVTVGQVTAGVDKALHKGGSITGKIIDADELEPLSHIVVFLYSWDGHYVDEVETDENGNYKIMGLPSGEYFTRTDVWGGEYLSQAYGGFECQGWQCPPISVTSPPVNVIAGEVTSNIDFSLHKGGVISGVVTASDSGAPLSDVHVEVVDDQGDYVDSVHSDSNGGYQIKRLSSGDYYLIAYLHDGDYSRQVYGVPSCPDCDVLEGVPVTVVEGVVIKGVDFSLLLKQQTSELGSISGTVFDAESADPIVGGVSSFGVYIGNEVIAVDLDGEWVAHVNFDYDGTYTLDGLEPGDYYIVVSQDGEYVGELYDGVACSNPWCDKTQAMLVTVAEGQDVVGIDFNLEKGGVISGVVSAVDGKYLGDYVSVSVFDINGEHLAYGAADSSGYYRITGLPEGEFFVRIELPSYYGQYYAAYPYPNQVYPGIECAGWDCDVTEGHPVAVSLGKVTSDIDFTLQKGGEITGNITASDSGGFLSFVQVEAYDEQGKLQQTSVANSKGEYKITGLATGQYYLKFSPVYFGDGFMALPNAADYMAELYGGVNCVGQCDMTHGSLVNVAAGQITEGIDVSLDTGDSITGKVTLAETGAALPYLNIITYDANGGWVGFDVWTDADGRYSVNGLAPGNYYLRIMDRNGYYDELYGGIVCDSGCVITDGTPVEVVERRTTTAVDIVIGQTDESYPAESSQDDQAQNNQTQISAGSGGGGGLIDWQLLLLMFCWFYYSNSRRMLRYRYPER